MSTNILKTLLLKLLFVIGSFLFIVAPLTMLAWKVMPPGRLRDVLFKVRTGPSATRQGHRDRQRRRFLRDASSRHRPFGSLTFSAPPVHRGSP